MAEHPDKTAKTIRWRFIEGGKALAALVLCAAATILASSAFGIGTNPFPSQPPSDPPATCSGAQSNRCDLWCTSSGYCYYGCTPTAAAVVCSCGACASPDGDGGGGSPTQWADDPHEHDDDD